MKPFRCISKYSHISIVYIIHCAFQFVNSLGRCSARLYLPQICPNATREYCRNKGKGQNGSRFSLWMFKKMVSKSYLTATSFSKLRLSSYIDTHKNVTNFCTRYNVFCPKNVFREPIKHKKQLIKIPILTSATMGRILSTIIVFCFQNIFLNS